MFLLHHGQSGAVLFDKTLQLLGVILLTVKLVSLKTSNGCIQLRLGRESKREREREKERERERERESALKQGLNVKKRQSLQDLILLRGQRED